MLILHRESKTELLQLLQMVLNTTVIIDDQHSILTAKTLDEQLGMYHMVPEF